MPGASWAHTTRCGTSIAATIHACSTTFLRGEWGFDGAVITDWGGAHDTKQAALNGLDIEMGTWTNGLTSESKSPYSDYYLANPYLNMIRSGEVPESTVDDKARNILRLIFRTAMNPDRPFGSATSPEHYAAAKRIGDEAIVLLKNNGILPLDPTKYKKVLVVGENAVRFLNEGGGSSELKVKDMFTPSRRPAQHLRQRRDIRRRLSLGTRHV